MSRLQAIKRILNPEAVTPRSSIASLVTEGGVGDVPEIAAKAQKLDDELDAVKNTNLFADAFKELKHVKYVEGQQDALAPIDWEFFRGHIKDPNFVDIVKKAHDGALAHLESKPLTMPEGWSKLEDVAIKMHEEALEAAAGMDKHFKVIDEEIKEAHLMRRNMQLWTIDDVLARKPKWAELIENKMANEDWAVRDCYAQS